MRREAHTPTVASAYRTDPYTFRKYWTGAEIDTSAAPEMKRAKTVGMIGVQQRVLGISPNRTDASAPLARALPGTTQEGWRQRKMLSNATRGTSSPIATAKASWLGLRNCRTHGARVPRRKPGSRSA